MCVEASVRAICHAVLVTLLLTGAGEALAQDQGGGRRGEGRRSPPPAEAPAAPAAPSSPAAPAALPAEGGAGPMMRQETEASAAELLDESLIANPERIARARAKAEQEPPATNDAATLMTFYLERGREAQVAGRQAQAISDLNRAIARAEAIRAPDRGPIYLEAARVQASLQRNVQAYRLAQKAAELLPQQRRGQVLYAQSLIASHAAAAGHIEVATRALREVQSLQATMRRNPNLPAQVRANSEIYGLEAEAAVQQARGQYAEAEPKLRRVIAVAAESRQLVLSHRRRLTLAHNLVGQGRLGEAEVEARAALIGLQRVLGPNNQVTASSLTVLARTLIEQGRVAEAEALIRRAIELMQGAGLTAAGAVRFSLAVPLAMQGRWPEAGAEIEIARRGLAQAPEDFEAALRSNPLLPLILTKNGRQAEATAVLADVVRQRAQAFGEGHYFTAEARGLQAVALAESGRADEAMTILAAAAPVLMARSGEAGDEEGAAAARDFRRGLILETYLRLLADRRGRAAAAESFQVAEAARGQSVGRALAASAARSAIDNPQLAALARREQDANHRLTALASMLANAVSARGEERDEAVIQALRQEMNTLRDQRAGTLGEIERGFPDYARLVNPQPAEAALVRRSLRPDEALVAFYVAEDRTYAWAMKAAGEIGFVSWPTGRAAVGKLVEGLRKALDPDAVSAIEDIPGFDLAAAYRLYAALLQPLEGAWGGAASLLVLPHGPLGQISIALLPTAPVQRPAAQGPRFTEYRSVPWLLRKAAVAQLPSAASLVQLRSLSASTAERRPFVGFGDPWFSRTQAASTAPLATRGKLRLRSSPKPGTADSVLELAQLPRLPETADEVRGVAATLRADSEVFLGDRATKKAVSQAPLRQYRVVMLATHGLVPGDLTGLSQPALALTSPEVVPDGGNGLLTMEDVLALKLDADWVVLSACNTAAGQGAGAEAISGLGRAFFYAGTRALLVSNWPVETTSAQRLTTDLFRRHAEDSRLSRAEAFRQAMLGLIDGPGSLDAAGKPQFSYAHPIFWAAFTLVGDAGGTGR